MMVLCPKQWPVMLICESKNSLKKYLKLIFRNSFRFVFQVNEKLKWFHCLPEQLKVPKCDKRGAQ